MKHECQRRRRQSDSDNDMETTNCDVTRRGRHVFSESQQRPSRYLCKAKRLFPEVRAVPGLICHRSGWGERDSFAPWAGAAWHAVRETLRYGGHKGVLQVDPCMVHPGHGGTELAVGAGTDRPSHQVPPLAAVGIGGAADPGPCLVVEAASLPPPCRFLAAQGGHAPVTVSLTLLLRGHPRCGALHFYPNTVATCASSTSVARGPLQQFFRAEQGQHRAEELKDSIARSSCFIGAGKASRLLYGMQHYGWLFTCTCRWSTISAVIQVKKHMVLDYFFARLTEGRSDKTSSAAQMS